MLCDQELETADHLFVNCIFAKQVRHAILATLGATVTSPPSPMEVIDWWLHMRKNHNQLKKKGLDSVVMLVMWCLWKERNGRTFGSRPASTVDHLIGIIVTEGQLWIKASAKWMAAAAWLEESTHILA